MDDKWIVFAQKIFFFTLLIFDLNYFLYSRYICYIFRVQRGPMMISPVIRWRVWQGGGHSRGKVEGLSVSGVRDGSGRLSETEKQLARISESSHFYHPRENTFRRLRVTKSIFLAEGISVLECLRDPRAC